MYEMAASDLAPTITPTAAGGFAGAALTIVFVMMYCFGTSARRAAKLPKRNEKAEKQGRKKVAVRAPVGPFNPENWDDVNGDGQINQKDAPKWVTGLTIGMGLAAMGLFLKVREIDGNSFWARPAQVVTDLTVKLAQMTIIQGVNPVYLGLFAVFGLFVAPWFQLRTKFFLAMAIAGLVVIGGGVPAMFMSTATETSGNAINSVVGQ
jgi:hypothetical protein